MVEPSRLEKSEQLVNVATPSPATTHEAARNRKEEPAQSSLYRKASYGHNSTA